MNLSAPIHALETASTWVWQTSLAATVLIALAWLIQILFKKTLPPRWNYLLSLLILVRLALPFAPASPLSVFNLRSHHASPPLVSVKLSVPRENPTVPTPTQLFPTLLPAVETSMPSLPSVTMAQPPPTAPTAKPHRVISLNLVSLAKYLWLAGCLGMLGMVAVRHRKFTLTLRSWDTVTEPRVLELLADCQAALGVRRKIILVAAANLNTPALFGVFRPRLLVPSEMLAKLGDRELRHIFLHELVHLRRGDLLVNWAMIFLRALHWFNPAVWLAMRRLRADQELACDAAVMARLADAERRHYGNTLLKLLDDFSAAGLCPGLVPFITHKQVIKRRITMIARFKPSGRLSLVTSFALMALLGCLTFTRAADQSANAPKPSSPIAGPTVQSDPVSNTLLAQAQTEMDELQKQINQSYQVHSRMGQSNSTVIVEQYKAMADALAKADYDYANAMVQYPSGSPLLQQFKDKVDEISRRNQKLFAQLTQTLDPVLPATLASGPSAYDQLNLQRGIEALAKELRRYDEQIAQETTDLDKLSANLHLSEDNGLASRLTAYQQQKIEAEMQATKYQGLLNQLERIRREDLIQALPSISPDSILQQLLQDRILIESKLTSLQATQGENSLELKTALALAKKNSEQIDERINGILNALRTQLDIARAQADDASLKIKETVEMMRDVSHQNAPYYQAKAELEQLKKFRDVLSERIVLAKLDAVMPQATPPQASNRSASAVIRIVVDDNNQIYLNDQAVSDDQLKSELTRLKALNPDLSVVITASHNAKFQKIVVVMDLLQGLGITRVTAKTDGSLPIQPAASPLGLIGRWSAEGNAADTLEFNNGKLQGGVTFTDGKVGQAFRFDGVNGTVVVPDSKSLRITSQITIAAWINPLAINGDQGIVSKISSVSGLYGYQFNLTQGSSLVGAFNSPGDGSWPTHYIMSPIPLVPGSWSHVVWTYDQSVMKLYFNGQLVASERIGPYEIATSPCDLRISGADDHTYFTGLIDEPSIYDTALSADQIQAMYDAGSAGRRAVSW